MSARYARLAVVGLTLGLAACDGNWSWPWSVPGPTSATRSAPGGTTNVFKGSVHAEWLYPAQTRDLHRDMRLLAPFGYIDPRGMHWDVPAGYVTNGASVPWGLWNIVGGPFDGPYRDAAVIHDYYCDKRDRAWEDVHKMFYEAAIARGTSENVAATMYAGIRFGGPRWQVAAATASAEPKKSLVMGQMILAQAGGKADPGIRRPSELQKQQFDELQRWIEKEKPSLAEIERKVEELRKQSGMQTAPAKPK